MLNHLQKNNSEKQNGLRNASVSDGTDNCTKAHVNRLFFGKVRGSGYEGHLNRHDQGIF